MGLRKKKDKQEAQDAPSNAVASQQGKALNASGDEIPDLSGDEGRALDMCRAFLRHRKLVIVVFVLAAIFCVSLIPKVPVSYSLIDYMPEDMPSMQAVDDMEDAFDSGIPNARLFAEGITLTEAQDLADKLADIEGINEVMWLGTAIDVKQPAAVQDEETVSSWTTDDGYLFQLTVDEGLGREALDEARVVAAEANTSQVSLEGSLVSTVNMQEAASVQIKKIMLVAVLIIIATLLLTSHSWFEPVVFLTVIGIAIVMNMGTNLLLGEISFVSQIVGAILQLAVSMDYAIVLLHTYRRCERALPDDPQEAMAHAMKRGFSVVLSSAAVTFFGFLSLTVMEFGIGANMGIVLAKGIVFSFLTVMFFMPCLTLVCIKPLNALQHRYLIPSLDKLARGCQKIMVPAAIIIVLIAIPCVLGQSHTDFLYGSSKFAAEGSQEAIERNRIEENFGAEETWVLMVPEGHWADEQALIDDIDTLDGVTGTTAYLTVAGQGMPVEVVPEDTASQVISNGWSRIVITSNLGVEGDNVFSLVEQVRDLAHSYYGDEYRLAGTAVSTYDLRDVVQADSVRVKLFSMISIGLVLALMFKSLTIPLVMLASIEVAIWINQAIPYFAGLEINYIGYLVIDAVQMGAAVDYAIIYAREYFDRRQHYSPVEAARSAVKHGGISILTSGCILTFAGYAIKYISTITIISEIGELVGRGGFISMLMMFLFLPCLFRILDGIICKTSLGLKFDDNGKGKRKKKLAKEANA